MKALTKLTIGKIGAIALYNSGWWNDKSDRDIALFQMNVSELCVPFDVFHGAMERTLKRPVFTHEFGINYNGLLEELNTKS